MTVDLGTFSDSRTEFLAVVIDEDDTVRVYFKSGGMAYCANFDMDLGTLQVYETESENVVYMRTFRILKDMNRLVRGLIKKHGGKK